MSFEAFGRANISSFARMGMGTQFRNAIKVGDNAICESLADMSPAADRLTRPLPPKGRRSSE